MNFSTRVKVCSVLAMYIRCVFHFRIIINSKKCHVLSILPEQYVSYNVHEMGPTRKISFLVSFNEQVCMVGQIRDRKPRRV